MLHDAGLVEDAEHEIYGHLSFRDCKSILRVSIASNQIMRHHLFTRPEDDFRRHIETWLPRVSLFSLLPPIMQPIEARFLKHFNKDKPTLSLFLLCTKIFTKSSEQPTTLTQLDLLLRDQTLACDFSQFISRPVVTDKTIIHLSDILVNHKQYPYIDLNKFKNKFSQADTTQLRSYLDEFKKIRVLHLDHKIVLTYLIPYLSDTLQNIALGLLKKEFLKKFDGGMLFEHIHYIASNLTKHVSSQPIIDYFAFIWEQTILLGASPEYNFTENQFPGSCHSLESSLPQLPLKNKRKIFLHYLGKLTLSSTNNLQRLRCIKVTTMLAPYMHGYLQKELLTKLSTLIDGSWTQICVLPGLLGFTSLIGNLSGRMRNLAFTKYFAYLPKKPTLFTPSYLSFLDLSGQIKNLPPEQLQLILDYAFLFEQPMTTPNPSSRMIEISDHITILINIAKHYSPAIEHTFNYWCTQINFVIESQRFDTLPNENITEFAGAILSRLSMLVILLSIDKRILVLDLFKRNIEHPHVQIRKFIINGLEQLAYFLYAPEQISIIELLWNVYIHDPDESIKKEALHLLNTLAIRIVKADVQAKIAELSKKHPDPTSAALLQSLKNTHTLFFQPPSTANQLDTHAHSSTYRHA